MYKRYALFLHCFVSLVTFLKGSSRISSSNCRCPPWLLLRWCLTNSSVNFAGSSRLVTVNTHSNVWGSCPSQFRTYGLKTYRCPVYEYEKTKHSMCEAFVQANLTRPFWKLTVVLCIDMKTPSIQCVRSSCRSSQFGTTFVLKLTFVLGIDVKTPSVQCVRILSKAICCVWFLNSYQILILSMIICPVMVHIRLVWHTWK